MNKINKIDPSWKAAEVLSLREAAALVSGIDPIFVADDCEGIFDPVTGMPTKDFDQYKRLYSIWNIMVKSIKKGSLIAELNYDADPVYCYSNTPYGNNFYEVTSDDGTRYLVSAIPNWNLSMISCVDLKNWLKLVGLEDCFFFKDTKLVNTKNVSDYLNPEHPRYAPKLAAAITAWIEVTSGGKTSVKQALETWLVG